MWTNKNEETWVVDTRVKDIADMESYLKEIDEVRFRDVETYVEDEDEETSPMEETMADEMERVPPILSRESTLTEPSVATERNTLSKRFRRRAIRRKQVFRPKEINILAMKLDEASEALTMQTKSVTCKVDEIALEERKLAEMAKEFLKLSPDNSEYKEKMKSYINLQELQKNAVSSCKKLLAEIIITSEECSKLRIERYVAELKWLCESLKVEIEGWE